MSRKSWKEKRMAKKARKEEAKAKKAQKLVSNDRGAGGSREDGRFNE